MVNAVDQLPEFQQASLSRIEEFLTQLQPGIEADRTLQSEAKAEALEQVKILAEAGRIPKQSQNAP